MSVMDSSLSLALVSILNKKLEIAYFFVLLRGFRESKSIIKHFETYPGVLACLKSAYGFSSTSVLVS